VSGPGFEHVVFDIYGRADVVMAMRFHGNVVPLGIGVPTVGIGTYPKIRDLYHKLGLDDWLVLADTGELSDRLLEAMKASIAERVPRSSRIREIGSSLRIQMDEFITSLGPLLQERD
jgi:polysaccharide pyruvyl transferase WcaK-like protein